MLAHLLLFTTLALTGPGTPAPAARAVVDTAIARMGGIDALQNVQQVRREMVTQWLRINFDDRPFTDFPSYELHADVRNYGASSWRNTRKFVGGNAATEIVVIVRDSVSIWSTAGKWAPLNVAYVDEQRELFTFAPERVLLLARAAADLRALPDTTITGAPHARVSGTINGFPTTLIFRRSDGLLAAARFRAGQLNDFGLAPWGVMEVELWYSRWQSMPRGITLPTQWDTKRVGRPYKRITVLATTFDSVAPMDSFLVSDSLRTAFLTTARRPMHDQPLDSAKVLGPRLASFATPGYAVGAVKLGKEWWLLESGQAPFSAERAAQWLASKDDGARVAGAMITAAASANGGIVWLAEQKRTIRGAPGFLPFGSVILRDHQQSASAITTVTRGQWHQAGGDSVWVEPIDYPDIPGAIYIYVPSLKWAYSGPAAGPLQQGYLKRRLEEHGFVVERLGSARGGVAAAVTK